MSAPGRKGETTFQDPTAAEQRIARRVAEARATVPHLELTVELPGQAPDAGWLAAACAGALRDHPRANGSYRDGRYEFHSRVNLGVILSSPESYLIPTLFDADRKGPDDLARELEQLRLEAERGELAAPALSGATFTLWNAAEHGLAQASLPVLPPQAGALAVGTRSLTLACDHRILYGNHAVGFLEDVRRRLELGRHRA